MAGQISLPMELMPIVRLLIINILNGQINSDDKLQIHLAPGGGWTAIVE